MALASGWEPEGPGLDKLAVAAWREHVCQIIADTILPHGFKSLQLLVDGGNTRNLAGWVRRRNPDVTRPDSQRLRVKLVTAAALAPAYKYLADAKERIRGRALSDEALAQASDKRKFHLQMLIYTGMRRELGDNLPLPPLPPA
jgi:hypothetical protein